MERSLPYWKARQIDMRNCLAAASPLSSYWGDLWNAYKFAKRKVRELEEGKLVKKL
jgi:hypothetical protein